MSVNLRSLIGRLNEPCRSALEGAAGLCLSRTHYDVEVEHYILKLLDKSDNDLAAIIKHYNIDRSRLSRDLMRGLDRLKTGNARTPTFSPTLVEMLTEAWTLGSLNFAGAQIRSGFCVLALLTKDDLVRLAKEISNEFQLINRDDLLANFSNICRTSAEETMTAAQALGEAGAGPGGAPGGGKTPNLDQYTVDLTANAKAGKIDPVLARDREIRQMVDILLRRRQNNPILVGEAGVGKTAVVEGFALRVAQGDVPPALKNITVRSLDLALLQAGAGVKGEFENRLKGLIDEVKRSETPIVLFIDEAHTMIGAGGQAGQNDAANLLKPALARGELRTVAATTWAEYKKFFEKDAALSRRFQPVKVEEPTEDQCALMLRGIIGVLEKHHNVRILDEGLEAAVRLSHRYLADRQLPDKAVSVLDTACARLALTQNSIPPALEDLQRTLDDLALQKRVLEREQAVGANHQERLQAIEKKVDVAQAEKAALEARYGEEKALVEKIRSLRGKLEETHGTDAEARAELDKTNDQLRALQGEMPLIRVFVDSGVVADVISAWTGVPVGKMVKDEFQMVLELEKYLGARIIGQDHALEAISSRLRTAKASMDDPGKPVGVFLLVGPSGVGKTETALALSDLMFGGERNMISINMSEFQEAHTVSTLKGSPPGYVGYGEGGVLTEAVRRRPYSVVLLDEVEKAHPDVLELFFQVFDKGQMEDGEGREIDFKNTIILLTSNAGTETLMKLTADPETMPGADGLSRALKPELDKIFKPAFLGRLVIIPYFPVRDEALKKIVRLKLNKIVKRIRENHRISMEYGEELVDAVAARCTEVESGARNVDNILTNTLLPEVSRMLLAEMAAGRQTARIQVGLGGDGSFNYTFEPVASAQAV